MNTASDIKGKLVKKAVSFAMDGLWSDAINMNQSIISDFPNDLETYNRLGKALTEIGRYMEAKAAFEHALELSPNNTIAHKNLERLVHLGGSNPKNIPTPSKTPQAFMKESGKSIVTSLVNIGPSKVLLRLTPGKTVHLIPSGVEVKVQCPPEEYIGQVEPKLAFKLVRLIEVGNRYEAVVTSVGEQALTIMVRETFRHPSQIGSVSFQSQTKSSNQTTSPSRALGFNSGYETMLPLHSNPMNSFMTQDWSNDDTEPGDDDDEISSAPTHRIIDLDEIDEEDA